MRTYLSPGTIIPVTGEGATRQVHIEQVIGEGASCIVYDGFFVDVPGVKERCRLKECYPLDAKVVRQGDRLVWSDPAERLSAQKRFQSIRQISFDMRYNPEVGNQITKSGYYENGDNFYLIMDINHGQTLDKENIKDINRILKIALKLTQLVGKLHNLGCRYLDLKPDNILVSNEPDPDIWLFDFDSLDDTRSVSYSRGWAAPELVQGKFSSLCNATDLYSIGAILFNKIMGRSVTNDDIGLFADWDFDGELFDDVNPKIQRYLREIFKKTLSASVKRRYQNASELELALERALGIVGKPYIISNIPDNASNFVGRDQELLDIREAFTYGNHIVFLTGIGGIGKSELAKRYGNMQQSNYDAVIFAPFEDSINSLLLNIDIQDFDGDNKQKIKQLNRLLDRRVLLVIDNMESEDVPDFNVLEKLKCDILITSRLDWREYSYPTIEIGAMSKVDQFGLFLKEYGGVLDIPQQQAVFRILSYIEGYTLLIPLIAKQLRRGHNSFDEMADNIQSAGIKAASIGKVRHSKDGMLITGSMYNILSKVFNMVQFTEDEEYVMRSLSMLSRYRIEQAELLQWIGDEYVAHIDDLVFRGWIIQERLSGTISLSLHPVISDLCVEELKPSIANCKGIRDCIWSFADEFAEKYKNPMELYWGGYVPTMVQANIQYQFDSYIRMMQWILAQTGWEDDESICFWIQVISRVTNVVYGDCDGFIPFLGQIVESAVQAEDYSLPYLAEAALALETIALKHEDLPSALEWAKFTIVSLGSVHNVEETVFRICFSFYQYICCSSLLGNEYWNIEGFETLAVWIQQMWKSVVDYDESIDLEDHNIWILSDGECTITTDEAIEQAYNDFCFKISQDGILREQNIYNDPDDVIDLSAILKRAATKHFPDNTDTSEIVSAFLPTETTFTLSEAESDLLARAIATEKNVNDIIDSKVFSSMGMWLVMNQRAYSETEKTEMYHRLSIYDTKLPYHNPERAGRTSFVYSLAQMEAAFSYAYAILCKWEEFDFHVKNLIKYYKILIFGRKYNSHFRRSGIHELKHLPGASSLLNSFYPVLPAERAQTLIREVIDIMEAYHHEQRFDFGDFYEMYDKALHFAKEVNNHEAIAYWEKRISIVSSVYFKEKTD